MTLTEANAGIGQRVTNTESGAIGTLQSVGKGSHYNVGVVAFDREVREVYLKILTFTDGLRTPCTLALPFADLLQLLSSPEVPKESRRRLFTRLLGRAPTKDEMDHMQGKKGRVCVTCGDHGAFAINPQHGTIELDCLCTVPVDESSSQTGGGY